MEEETIKNDKKTYTDPITGKFIPGNPGGGRPLNSTIPPEKLAFKKAQRDLIKEYKEKLAEALPLISPVLIAKALEGDMVAIKELNDRVMGKSKETLEMQGEVGITWKEEKTYLNNKSDETQS